MILTRTATGSKLNVTVLTLWENERPILCSIHKRTFQYLFYAIQTEIWRQAFIFNGQRSLVNEQSRDYPLFTKSSQLELHKIPPRSADVNPIENIFHLVKSSLQRETVSRNIVSECFEQFQTRVLLALDSVSVEIIDRTIASMSKRIQAVRYSKGHRTKYWF